jgi:hypothetical protein
MGRPDAVSTTLILGTEARNHARGTLMLTKPVADLLSEDGIANGPGLTWRHGAVTRHRHAHQSKD